MLTFNLILLELYLYSIFYHLSDLEIFLLTARECLVCLIDLIPPSPHEMQVISLSFCIPMSWHPSPLLLPVHVCIHMGTHALFFWAVFKEKTGI